MSIFSGIRTGAQSGVRPVRWLAIVLALAAGLPGMVGTAVADGYYSGFAVGLDFPEGEYRKSVRINDSAAITGGVRVSKNSDNDQALSAKALFGRRWDWSPEHYFSLEADAAVHGGGRIRGFLDGTGTGARDVWPGAWHIDENYSAGVTAKLGYHLPAMQEMLGAGSSLYLLGGVRWLDLDVEANFRGMPAGSIVEGTTRRNEDVHPWSAGAGLEFEALAGWFHIELRYTEYDFDWDNGSGADLENPYVKSSFDVEEWGLFFGYSLPLFRAGG